MISNDFGEKELVEDIHAILFWQSKLKSNNTSKLFRWVGLEDKMDMRELVEDFCSISRL